MTRWVALAAIWIALGCDGTKPAPETAGGTSGFEEPPLSAGMKLESASFARDAAIPKAQTCEGGDRAPALAWSGLPEGTKSLVIIVDDPDAPDPANPKTTWVHWLVYDIPPTAPGIPDGGELPSGARQGTNDFKHAAYGGPCPPTGRHRYFHKLYALDRMLGDLGEPTKPKLLGAMKGHVLGKAELVGTYQK